MRFLLMLLTSLLMMFGAIYTLPQGAKAATESPRVTLDVSEAAPRAVEESTVNAVLRDYAAAWAQLAAALEQNRRDLLDVSFVGNAHDSLAQLVSSQQKNGIRQRYIDNGHKLKAIFYSADGSALQLVDTAQMEVQLLDGDKVVSARPSTLSYMVILTPAENKWKIRVLQSVALTPSGK